MIPRCSICNAAVSVGPGREPTAPLPGKTVEPDWATPLDAQMPRGGIATRVANCMHNANTVYLAELVRHHRSYLARVKKLATSSTISCASLRVSRSWLYGWNTSRVWSRRSSWGVACTQ